MIFTMAWNKESMPNFFALIDKMAKRYIELLKSDYKMPRTVHGKRRSAYASGNLYNSMAYRLNIKSNTIEIRAFAKGSASKYFEVREFGRKKGTMPPVSAIEKWMKIKPIKLHNKTTGAFLKSTPELQRQVAYQIAKKIQRDGIEGWNGNAYAIENVMEEYGDKINEAYAKDVKFTIEQNLLNL